MASNEDFFQRDKLPAAVLKHGILRRYLARFAGATAYTSPGGRVAFIDGFAGEGEYRNELTGVVSEGSPRIALKIAEDLRKSNVRLECTFVEKKKQSFTRLAKVVQNTGDPYAVAWCGDISDHLHAALDRAKDIPTLVFLDPFGKSLDHDATLEVLLQRGDDRPTELLVNFSLQTLRRFGGRVYEPEGAEGRKATLEGGDRWLGGSWWQDVFKSPEVMALPVKDRAHQGATLVSEEYVRRVREAWHCHSFTVEIRRKPSDKPLFLLCLFFPRVIASYKYNEAVSKATEEWRMFLAGEDLMAAERDDELSPRFGESRVAELQAIFKDDETATNAQAIDDISNSVLTHLKDHAELHVTKNLDKVFGAAVGIGRETHLRSAWKSLAKSGHTNDCPKGPLEKTTIRRASAD